MIDLERRLRRGLMPPLPGVQAQLRMAPQPRPGWNPGVLPEAVRDAAALLLCYPVGGAPHIVLTVRGSSLRNHTGQVSLPGGRVDAGESIEDAALREAREEVGVEPAAVRLIGRLTPLHVVVSGYLLHPVVGVMDVRPAFVPCDREVARIVDVPLALLRDPATVKRHTLTRDLDGATVEIEVPYFDIAGEKVWGATAMVLSELLAVLGP